jgi:uncharacterized membrane protein YphA (DoxX/SURF4 family)
MASAKTRTVVLWTLSVALALLFLMSGASKLANKGSNPDHPTYDGQFVAWGFPSWARFVVGPVELAAAVLVLVPGTRFWGAAAMTALMVGAVPTHLLANEAGYAPFPAVLGLLAGTVAWMARPRWVRDLLAGRRPASGPVA